MEDPHGARRERNGGDRVSEIEGHEEHVDDREGQHEVCGEPAYALGEPDSQETVVGDGERCRDDDRNEKRDVTREPHEDWCEADQVRDQAQAEQRHVHRGPGVSEAQAALARSVIPA